MLNTRPPFQFDKDVYVRHPNGLLLNGKRYAKGERVPWKELSMDKTKIQRLYVETHLMHKDDEVQETVKPKSGDGLEELSAGQLDILVKSINEKVKAKTKDATEFQTKKCKSSKIHAKQIGLIRTWRSRYGELEA